MAADEQLKRPLVAVRDELFQQFGISDLGFFALARDASEVADDTHKLTGRHDSSPYRERPVPN